MNHIRPVRDNYRETILAIIKAAAVAYRAIRFYQRHGFEQVSPAQKAQLLKTYWTIPDSQVETSVVLANPPLQRST